MLDVGEIGFIMNFQSILNCVLILFGAGIMLLSIIRVKELMQALPFVPERHRQHIIRYMILHRGLMIFFLIGYLVVLAGVCFHFQLVTEIILSLILFLGAIFVFIGVLVQSRLLSEIQNTLHGMLPICAKCKKIRVENGNYKDPLAWKRIEDYISEKTNVGFSHGYCPECYAEELKNIDAMEKRR